LNPNCADAYCGRGNVYRELKRYDEAFAAYDKALSIKSDLAEAWIGRGNVHTDLRLSKQSSRAIVTPIRSSIQRVLPGTLRRPIRRCGNVINEVSNRKLSLLLRSIKALQS
jgi:tetratricopeptide (TPR) repeat protein